MEQVTKNYLNGVATPAELYRALNVEIPKIRLNDVLEEPTRRNVETFLNAVPATDVTINFNRWNHLEEEICRGLMTGRYLETLTFINCREPIICIPPSVTSVYIVADENCHAISGITNMESIRRMVMAKGRIDHRTWDNIAARSTKLELELRDTEIMEWDGAANAKTKLAKFITDQILDRGERINDQEINIRIMRNYN